MPAKPPITGYKQIDDDNKESYNDGVEWYNRIVAEFERNNPELPLTTPMPANSTIMIEPEKVWQKRFPRVSLIWETMSNEPKDYGPDLKIAFRQAYVPITADQQSEGEKGIKEKGHMGGTPPPGFDDFKSIPDKKVCGKNCDCKTGEDCDGESALNFIESLKIPIFDSDEDTMLLNGISYTEKEAVYLANKILTNYYTDYEI